jgi:hypothetical protein
VPAIAGVGLNSSRVIVFANGAAILFGFYFGRERAVAQVVRALNGLLHEATIPSLALGLEPLAKKRPCFFAAWAHF